jgi:hypothetical protein
MNEEENEQIEIKTSWWWCTIISSRHAKSNGFFLLKKIQWLRLKNLLRYTVDHYNVGLPNTFGVDKLTERTNVTNGDVFKGPERNFYSIRD